MRTLYTGPPSIVSSISTRFTTVNVSGEASFSANHGRRQDNLS